MTTSESDIATLMTSLGRNAKVACRALAKTTGDQRDDALRAAATSITESASEILEANKLDMATATERGLTASALDRLMLDSERIEAIAHSLRVIAEMEDPIGETLDVWQRPNGLRIERVSVPLGVIGIIYESRPNVTADAAALCLKSANAVILRGGSESFHSSLAIHECIVAGLEVAGIDTSSVQIVPTRDRNAVGFLLSSMTEWLDVVVPRGGKQLIKRVQQEARVPVIGHLEGLCHVYVHAGADVGRARDVVLNSKMRRTGICGAAETILVDRDIAAQILPLLAADLIAAGCEIRGDEIILESVAQAVAASDEDWTTEYLDAIVAMRVVDDLDAAVSHIARYGSSHTESIVTEDADAAARFLREVDSAIVLHNASTQFADGGEFGMGAEIGIATGRIHARGPVGARQLTSYKYVVHGNGQIRP